MAATVKERVRNFRSRRKAGLVLVPITVTERVIESLIDAHLLPASKETSREAIARATEKFLQTISEGEKL